MQITTLITFLISRKYLSNVLMCDNKQQSISKYLYKYYLLWGQAVVLLVEALRHKLKGRGFDSRCFH